MPISTAGVVNLLHNLMQVCKNGSKAYETAAAGVGNQDLRSLLQAYAQQRNQFVTELQNDLQRLDGSVETKGPAPDTLHRGRTTLGSGVPGADEAAIMADCERGEDAALKAYQEALGQELPADVRALLERQLAAVREAQDRIRGMEVAASAL